MPIGPTGYNAAVKLTGQNPATNAIVGFSGAWTGDTGTIAVRSANLAYPGAVELASSGGSFAISHTANGNAQGRQTSRSIASSGLPTSGTLYFSVLIRGDALAFGALANNQAYYFGVGTTDLKFANDAASTFPSTGVFVGFKKVSGTVQVALGVNGASFELVPTAVADTTYFCVVEVQLNAGAGGNERVSAVVDPLVPGMAGPCSASTEAALVASGSTFTFLTLGGMYGTNSGNSLFDEFVMADTFDEVCPLSVSELMILSASATDVDAFSATANANLVAIGEHPATVLLDWGESEDALNTTTNLGVFAEAGTVETVLDGLKPLTTYCYRHRAEDGQNVSTSLVTTAFTTTGAALFDGLGASNVLSTAYLSGTLADPGVGPTTVSLWFGTTPGALAQAKAWAPVSASTDYAWSIPDCTLGATYHYAFKAEFDYGGDTYTFWSSTNALLMRADVVWTGAGSDAAWGTGGNWDLGFAPLAVSTATIGQGASVTAAADGVANVLQVNASAPVSIDFTGHSLAVPTVHVGTKTTSELTLKGDVAVDALFRIGDASASGSTVVLEDGAALNVAALQVGYSSANNVFRVLDGASVTATSEALVLTTGGKFNNTIYVGTGGVFTAQAGIRVDDNANWFVIDGGTVTNSGSYYNGLRKSNATIAGATLDIVNGGFMKQIGTLRGSPWYRDRVRVMNGGVLEAGAITIGTDGDSGSGGRLIVSNGTVTASGLRAPADDRHQNAGVLIYEDPGRTTTVAIAGDMNLGVYDSRRTGDINRNNLLNIHGGSIAVDGAFTMGNTKVAAHSNNVVRVLGRHAAFSAGSFTACNYSRIEYAIPAEGFDTTPIQIAGAATLDPTTTFKVDATAFVQGGMVTLLSAGTLASTMPDERIVVTVKPGYTSAVSQEDNAVKVRIAPSATVVILR
ncbi:MAG: hypothetical protein ACOX9C_06320 [Kiritimatiellia bacterium]